MASEPRVTARQVQGQTITAEKHFDQNLRRSGLTLIAGVDEAGRGPLAGPVFASAVILPPDNGLPSLLDSKRHSAARREALAETIRGEALAWSVARVEHDVIDRVNILQATLMAMAEAVRTLPVLPDLVLIDGTHAPDCPFPFRCVPKGDSLSQSVGAASILAKVERDRVMVRYAQTYPQYGFERHKGYGTAEHLAALAVHGPCPIHRRTFGGVGGGSRGGR